MLSVKHSVIHVPSDVWNHPQSELLRVCKVLDSLECREMELNLTSREEYAAERQLAECAISDMLDVFGLERAELSHDSGDDIVKLVAYFALHVPRYAEAKIIRREWHKVAQSVLRKPPNWLLGKLSSAIGLPGIWGFDRVETDVCVDVPAPLVKPYRTGDSCRLMIAPGAAILRALNILWALYAEGSYSPQLLDQFQAAFGKAVETRGGVFFHQTVQ